MEEEPNDHELEERLYAMLHHVDETQANVNTDTQNNPARLVENAPWRTVRRYWRTNSENARNTNPYSKINTPKDSVPAPVSQNPTTTNTNNTKPKEEKNGKPEPAVDLSLFQSPPQIVNRTIEILEHENKSFVLESSDEDEVIEVELPPKPTITIESSDEDDVSIVSKPETPSKDQPKNYGPENATPTTAEREISASPVPSVVSSVSDDFIRGDCIALNISSRHSDNHSFDFSLHGSDLLGQVTPSKKKKKKKSKEAITSTPIRPAAEKPSNVSVDTCFATPKSKAKNKKQKAKSYSVSEKSLPSADVYDSDSNQSAIEPIKDQAANNVSEKIIPNSDIYESDASLPVNKTDKSKSLQNDHGNKSSDVSTSLDQSNKDNKTKSSKKNDTTAESYKTADSIVDLTDSDNFITLDTSDILCENIVIANVTGFKESEDYGDKTGDNDAPKFGSTKVPQILFENLDFDNLKGKDKVCKRRKYSLTTLRAEMEKFYNESWGGEDFNHREIQKYMSRDKNLWVIDPKDRMPSLSKRKVTCNYCNRPGHRDDTCRQKPPVCHMCGSTGHYEPRCPSKICVNCGSPNFMYSTMCRNCATWDRVTCAECGQGGHPSSHCPDIWRRYHNTISMNMPLAENRQIKRNSQLYCSGCTRRGHLVHACRSSLPFSGLPLNSPYVAFYRPVFVPTEEEPDQPRRQLLNKTFPQDSATAITQRNKRQAKSPMHEAHVNKKKNIIITEIVETPEKQKTNEGRQRKYSQGKAQPEENKAKELGKSAEAATVEPAPDFIPISTNTDKQGQMIQDNEVSDTSDVVSTARIYITPEIIHKLKTPESQYWLNEHMLKHDVTVQSSDVNSFLTIKGKFADQEFFQNELREWLKPTADKENPKSDNEGDITLLSEHDQQHSSNIPKQRNTVLRKISKALESLKNDLGDPKDIYKELNFLQNKHDHLLQQKVISPKQLNNNRDHINIMLKKLNMVLLGQAGLADGSVHLNELHSLREKLTNFRQKSISLNMRREIGKHYHSIFTAIPRNDYADLLNMYYVARKDKIMNRKNDKLQRREVFVSSLSFPLLPHQKKRKRQRRNINPVAAAQTQTFPSIANQDGNKNVVHRENTHSKKNAEHISMKKLTYFHRRVMNTRPADSVHKKTRMELARKLHTHIASLNRNEKMSSKTMKKVKRIQEQAALFLNNV